MTTLAERDARLVAHLEAAFPGVPVVPALLPFADARGTGMTHPLEVRVLPTSRSAAGAMRWSIELVLTDARGDNARRDGTQGLFALLQQLLGALAAPESRWKPLGGRGVPGAMHYCWTEAVEERAGASGRAPQALCSLVEGIAVAAGGIASGASNFGTVTPTGPEFDAGDAVFLEDAAGLQYLGRILTTTPDFTVEFATARAFTGPVLIVRMNDAVHASDAVAETVVHALSDDAPAHVALDGHRRRTVLHAPRFEFRLAFDPVAEADAQAWSAFVDATRERASLLLARSDLSMLEVTPVARREEVPAGGPPLTAELRFLAAPARDLAPFTEFPP